MFNSRLARCRAPSQPYQKMLSALLLEGAQAQGAGVIVTSVGSRLRLPYHKIFTL